MSIEDISNQDLLTVGNLLFTAGWMAISYVLFKLQLKTFQVQADTFKEQQKISTIENRKFLLSIRPEYVITRTAVLPTPITMPGHSPLDYQRMTLTIELREHVANDVKVINNTSFLTAAFQSKNLIYMRVGGQLAIISGDVSNSKMEEPINLEIRFADEIGTNYHQKILGTCFKPQISPPINLT